MCNLKCGTLRSQSGNVIPFSFFNCSPFSVFSSNLCFIFQFVIVTIKPRNAFTMLICGLKLDTEVDVLTVPTTPMDQTVKDARKVFTKIIWDDVLPVTAIQQVSQ